MFRKICAFALFTMMAVALLCVTTAPLGAAPVFSVSITFDEFGNGTLTNTNGFFGTLPASFIADPGPGGLPSVLNYGLLNPPGLVGGDVLVFDPSSAFSDVLRFDVKTGGGSVFVYSIVGGGSPADIGLPTAFNTNAVGVIEVTGGGFSGITYTPTAGQPGFVAGAGGPVTYNFISDSPEPSSLLMVLSVAAVPFVFRRYRKV